MKKYFSALLLSMAMVACVNKAAKQDTTAGFVGQWTSDSTNVQLVFFKDVNNKMQMVQWDNEGEEIEIVSMEVSDSTIKTTERTRSTNHVIYNTYKLQNPTRLEDIIRGDANDTIYYKRVK
jgi:hypothetical protein